MTNHVDGAFLGFMVQCSACSRAELIKADASYISGGCTGHGPEEYCYCDSAHLELSWTCACGKLVDIDHI